MEALFLEGSFYATGQILHLLQFFQLLQCLNSIITLCTEAWQLPQTGTSECFNTGKKTREHKYLYFINTKTNWLKMVKSTYRKARYKHLCPMRKAPILTLLYPCKSSKFSYLYLYLHGQRNSALTFHTKIKLNFGGGPEEHILTSISLPRSV